ncbi:LPXTG cell wall anchor domain-containing protein [Micromonospora sp. NPDC051006]|uniref:LPXTG cell wall anchor domain-containing protein n=1 Tax=Micromonospora sp. NPDC051006 TaxID=3364283 RepID=UPI003799114F
MPASTRHHKALAVVVHCLGILAAVPALPAVAREPAAAHQRPPAVAPEPSPSESSAPPTGRAGMPAAPPAVPTPTQAMPPPPKPPVTVAVAPAPTPAPAYRIHVRNSGSAPVETTIRQELPPGSAPSVITAGGRASHVGAQSASEVTWRLKLPARSVTTLNTSLATAPAGQPVTAPACAFTSDGSRPYDCATATWSAAATGVAKTTSTPLWQRTPVLLGVLGAVLLLAGAGWWLWRRRRRPVAAALADGAAPSSDPRQGRGTIYPRPATPRPASRRRSPPVWLLVSSAVVVLAAIAGTAGWTATRRVAAIDTDKQPTSGAWMGSGAAGAVGVPLRETAFEFTVYRMACSAAAATTGRQCQATVGVRNLTPEHQAWHGQLQRAYLPGGRWVSTDEPATRKANLGRDVFAQPVAAGSRVVLPLVFTVDGRDPPKQLELRSGVFSAGVRVDVP